MPSLTPSVGQRAENESRFHDDIATQTDISTINVDAFFHASTAIENQAILRFFGPTLAGKKLLDIGCGYGEASVYFSKQGAQVEGIDISDGMLALARALAERFGVQPNLQRSMAEKLPFADNSFDFIYGNGVLHHVTLQEAIPEIRRVLKPGGKAAFIEPLPFNPAINVYRRMATHYRSDDEAPISLKQIRRVRSQFSRSRHEEYWLSALAVFVWMYVIDRVHPNDAPYWKKVIYDADRYAFLTRPLLALDRVLTRLPLVRWLAWNTVLMLEK